eukprot:TRINITY_DN47742_c0_g1_i1.p2 TRINITY_DN47742_c0_g1~~TRINITY_DN47742_c0_g1_i1.p2  ORF type:complete len:139 (+),score=38.96 TRINITY_DN47742_c0_g1_i1:383-799(+)
MASFPADGPSGGGMPGAPPGMEGVDFAAMMNMMMNMDQRLLVTVRSVDLLEELNSELLYHHGAIRRCIPRCVDAKLLRFPALLNFFDSSAESTAADKEAQCMASCARKFRDSAKLAQRVGMEKLAEDPELMRAAGRAP